MVSNQIITNNYNYCKISITGWVDVYRGYVLIITAKGDGKTLPQIV